MTQINSNRTESVLVLQGGGALGAYQAGVFESLGDAQIVTHWVAGISIGAINAALIAGNPRHRRIARLREFWQTVSSALPAPAWPVDGAPRAYLNEVSAAQVALVGVPGFFTPWLLPPPFQHKGTIAPSVTMTPRHFSGLWSGWLTSS
jgi:NTE family protein